MTELPRYRHFGMEQLQALVQQLEQEKEAWRRSVGIVEAQLVEEHAEANAVIETLIAEYGFCSGCTYPNEIDCRRHAPARGTPHVGVDGTYEQHSVWPRVHRSDWCGDFEAEPAPPRS